MHMKLRSFQWVDHVNVTHRRAFTGSMNPEMTALGNDETLLDISDGSLIDRYMEAYNATLYYNIDQSIADRPNVYDPSESINLLYSKYAAPYSRDVISELIAKETEVCEGEGEGVGMNRLGVR
jgi:hypothetical protein